MILFLPAGELAAQTLSSMGLQLFYFTQMQTFVDIRNKMSLDV